jgi:hypothetical protein
MQERTSASEVYDKGYDANKGTVRKRRKERKGKEKELQKVKGNFHR